MLGRRCDLNAGMLAREVARIAAGGRVAVRLIEVGGMVKMSVFGFGKEIVMDLAPDDLGLSLDDFYRKHLKDRIPEGSGGAISEATWNKILYEGSGQLARVEHG